MVFPTSQFSAFNVGKNSSLATHGSLHVHLWGGREGWSNCNESCHSTNETAKKNNKSHMSEESLNDSILKPNLTSFNMMKTSFLSRPEVAFRSYCCEKISHPLDISLSTKVLHLLFQGGTKSRPRVFTKGMKTCDHEMNTSKSHGDYEVQPQGTKKQRFIMGSFDLESMCQPRDFEDSGVLKRSSFSRKIHHPESSLPP